jgi:hypothetical protein
MSTDKYEVSRGALSINRFCKRYSVGRTFTYNEIKNDKLRAVKCGTRTLILECDAEAWARSLPAIGAGT